MKKTVFLLVILSLLVACNMNNNPKSKVEAYLDKYTSLDEVVLEDMETKILDEDLNDENRDLYRKILTREYENLKYEIKDETIDGDKAYVTTRIIVYDLFKVDSDALNYMSNHTDEFENSEGLFDNNLFNKYRLESMMNSKDTVEYEITFNLKKINDVWVMNEIDRDTLLKIHGMYDYKNEK